MRPTVENMANHNPDSAYDGVHSISLCVAVRDLHAAPTISPEVSSQLCTNWVYSRREKTIRMINKGKLLNLFCGLAFDRHVDLSLWA